MTMTSALSNAISGLTMNARGSATVANNVANALTPGYARREMTLSAQGYTGGVRISSIDRIVNAGLLAETRSANGAEAEGQVVAKFLTDMGAIVGMTGESGSLGSAMADLRVALISAGARPDDDVRLSGVVASATTLTRRLNVIGDAIQNARSAADAQIGVDVDNLNADLKLVAELNEQIASIPGGGGGTDVASLYDQRQIVIDRISVVVPVQEIARAGGKVALFTVAGTVLLDGTAPVTIGFTPTPQLTAAMSVGTPPVGGLTYDGKAVPDGRGSQFGGGSLAANFAIRDDLAPQIQREIDAVALDLHDRFADPTIDPTLTVGAPGLFTDLGAAASLSDIAGLSSRLRLNSTVDVAQSGSLWKIRAGIGATTPGAVGDGTLLNALSDQMKAAQTMQDTARFGGTASLDGFTTQLESRIATRRVSQDADVAARSSRAATLNTQFLSDAVDTDAEMARLLQFEQAYAANAKVIQTIGDMMDAILRMS